MRIPAPFRLAAAFAVAALLCPPPVAASERLSRRRDREGNSFAVRVRSGGRPIAAADIFIGIHRAGSTDGSGVYRHFYSTRPEQSLHLAVRKPGYREWKGQVRIRPGAEFSVELIREGAHRLLLQAVTERFGVLSGLAGMEVWIDGVRRGLTGAEGDFFVTSDEAGPVDVEIRHPAGLTPPWKERVELQGDMRLRRFFYPMEPEALRVGIRPFRANGYRDEPFRRAMEEIRSTLAEELSRLSDFQILDDTDLEGNLEWFGIDDERLSEKGWEDTDLRWNLDLVLLGSVGRDDEFVVEVEARGPGAEEILRVLGRAADPGDFTGCGRRIARAIRDRYPYRGWVLEVEEDELLIQIAGESGWRPRPGDPVLIHSFVRDASGRRLGGTPVGTARIFEVGEEKVRARVEMLHADRGVAAGDLAVRYVAPPPGADGKVVRNVVARAEEGERFHRPLEGVNVYLDGFWIGRTDREGRAELRLPEGGPFRLDLYRHGYGPVKGTIETSQDQEETQFLLPRRLSKLRIDSRPSGAGVWLDGEFLGRTPLKKGIDVALGDHVLRVEAQGDYHRYRRTISFHRPLEDLTGGDAVVLERDFLALARTAEREGDTKAAMAIYRQVPVDHPDAWEARRRLAFHLLRRAGQPEEAIEVFQEILGMEEVFPESAASLVEVFGGIGQAYFNIGAGLEGRDPEMAQTRLLQALFYLQRGLLITEILPEIDQERVLYDISWHRALAYQKLYALTASREFLREADAAWRDYFDSDPVTLQRDPEFRNRREAGRRFWSEVQQALP